MTDRLDKRGVTDALEQIASFMELKGENLFRVRTFRTVARVVGGLPETLRQALDDGSLAATKGVGPATLEVITELATSGRLHPPRGAPCPGAARAGRDARRLRTRRRQDPADSRDTRNRLPP